jgi:hypothetical protein
VDVDHLPDSQSLWRDSRPDDTPDGLEPLRPVSPIYGRLAAVTGPTRVGPCWFNAHGGSRVRPTDWP